MNFAVTKLPSARAGGPLGATPSTQAPALQRPMSGQPVRSAPTQRPAPLQAPRARGALRALCQARPDSGSQAVYTELRILQPTLAQHSSTEVRLHAADLATVLEAYREDEKILAREPGMSVVLDVGLKAAQAAGILLGILEAIEKKAQQRTSLRRAKVMVAARREELQTLAWRARLELCLRADSANKD